MSAVHRPDGWAILKFSDDGKVVYKVFATWRWDNDKWRLSSGAKDLSELSKLDGEYVWPQASGSTYHLPIEGEHCSTPYQSAVLDNIKAKCIKENIEFEIITIGQLAKLH